MSSASWNWYHAAFCVGDVNRPCDVGVVGGQLGDSGPGGVVAEDPEARGLAFERARGVLVRVQRRRLVDLWSDEELVGAVADARDPDRRVDRRPHDLIEGSHG